MEDLAIDDLDREIIRFLQYDGRTPFTEIAEQIDVSEGTVRRRMHRLLDSGIWDGEQPRWSG